MADGNSGERDSKDVQLTEQYSQDETTLKEHGMNAANVHYEGDVCVYTDPESSFQYEWDGIKNEWVPRTKNAEEMKAANAEAAESSTGPTTSKCIAPKSLVSPEEYQFDGESYIYKDSQSGVTYKYDTGKNSWVIKADTDSVVKEAPKEKEEHETDSETEEVQPVKQDMTKGTYGFEGDTHTYTDPTDGSVYIWDREKNAWFPKVDDEFLARYQLSYGFTETAKPPEKSVDEEEKEKEAADKAKQEALKRKAAPQEPTWFELDEQHNTKVYVSNLPLDITEQEFVDVMQKCGLVMRDVDTGKMKVKLYTDPVSGELKGDGLCSYIKVESVDLALQLLDGYELRGHRLSVERAQFQMKGAYDPSRKPKRRRKKDKEKIKKMQEKLFAWQPDKLRGERAKHERVVIIKNLFEPQIFDKEVSLLLEYQQELREECQKCGDVRRVVIYDRHPEGVAQVTFREPEEADACIQLLNGRWYNQRKITAETWDGKTKYKIVETEEEVQKRLKKWEQFLESEEGKKASGSVTDTSSDNESTAASKGSDTDDKVTCQEEENNETKNEESTGDRRTQEKSDLNDSCGESDADTEGEDGDESESVKKADGRSH
ncbi:HIV Tat-specific factor 1 homolog [Schistocerca gregaria]|uniref:HIV Tat-specific factor 1 homolog n=1 Tax=Schistocerca gregaria TaxID=7010 RepID=UPI00211DCBD5|nr:HIV Tat-specific factor 1 homolog [Schistocerca gregaria]